jgi:hypothetical protein
MTKINGAYVFFGLFVVVIIGLWVTGSLFKTSKLLKYPNEKERNSVDSNASTIVSGGKRKRKIKRR